MGRQGLKKTTIVDIAAAAGVSVSTVSRILNNKPDVAEETRQRVLQVMEERRFAPQSAWQQLRSGKSKVLSLHFPQDFNQPSQNIITSAARACARQGYSLNLIAHSLTESDLLAIYESGQSDGMILMEILTHDWRVELLRHEGRPFVMIGHCLDNTGLSYVDVDIAAGVKQAIGHLVELGHRNIGFVTTAPVRHQKEYGYTATALRAYHEARRAASLPDLWQPVEPAAGGAIDAGDATSTVDAFLAAHPEVTALVTPQDSSLPGAWRAIQRAGLHVPDDISVIGLIDESVAAFITPPLTAIDFPSRLMGEAAVNTLIRQLNDPDAPPVQQLLPARFILRQSTAAVGQADR